MRRKYRRNSPFVVKTDIFKKIPTKPNERFEKEQKMIETCKDNGSCENNKHKGGTVNNKYLNDYLIHQKMS